MEEKLKNLGSELGYLQAEISKVLDCSTFRDSQRILLGSILAGNVSYSIIFINLERQAPQPFKNKVLFLKKKFKDNGLMKMHYITYKHSDMTNDERVLSSAIDLAFMKHA